MQVERIYVFPVKSLKGIAVKESPIDEWGFQYDRVYALAYPRKDGYAVLTQRQEPAMARIHTEIAGKDLLLSYTENGKHRTAKLPLDLSVLPQNMPTLDLELWGFDMVCNDVGVAYPEVKQFFADFFAGNPKFDGVTVISSKVRRPVPAKTSETEEFVKESGRDFSSSFQDLYPGSLMTDASFDELRNNIETMGGEPIHEQSFRMNMVLSTDEAWIEDDWKRLRIGEHEWFVDSLCERCTIPAVDQDRGVTRPTKQPLPELNRFRIMEKGKTPCFGVNLFNKDSGFLLRVGDRVEVLESH